MKCTNLAKDSSLQIQASIKNDKTITNTSKGTKKEFSLPVETVMWSGHLENNFIKQLEVELPCDAGILPLGI